MKDTLCGATHEAGNTCHLQPGHVGPHDDYGIKWAFDDRNKATFRFPRSVLPKEMGWTIDFGYLSKLQGDIPGDDENHGAEVSLETIEAVLLAVERNYDPRDHE